MLRAWPHQIAAWIKRNGTRAAARGRARRHSHGSPVGATLSQLEVLESRQMLTLLVAVHVNGNSINLTEMRGGSTSTADNVAISYTSSEVDLTGSDGTSFKVNGQTETTDTINITGPASISMRLNKHINSVTITGDGTDSLSKLRFGLNAGQQTSTLTLTSVIAASATITGRRPNDSVTLNQSTINGNLNALIGSAAGDTLDLESTTVDGNLRDQVGQATLDQSTIDGKLHNVEGGKDSTLSSTDTTYDGDASFKMGPGGVINLISSDSGSNEFQSAVTITGNSHSETTINQDPGSVFFSVNPTTRNATFNTTNPTLGTPTVNSQTVTTEAAPLITGTFDSVNTSVLTVAANGQTFTLGTNSQLTSPSAGQWQLDLGGATLTSPVTSVTVTSTDHLGNTTTGTGTITDGAGIIANYLAANNLTATTTADGLNYVIMTKGTGAIPTAGETVTVNYSGFLLNSNGTIGTEFDSNTDPTFGHVTPFSFTLGAGQVIAGWDEAFALLPVGTVAQLIIPPSLAYGSAGSGTSIPPNSILVFSVTLVSAT
jgi:FKBP-type peptidyl-prolyl isomerase-like protein